ncbi:MAG: hypothetical protein P8Y94_02880 [Acidobacteriota bacterium]
MKAFRAPAELERLTLRSENILSEDERAWAEKPILRRKVVDALICLAGGGGDGFAPPAWTVLRNRVADWMMAMMATPEWSRVMGFLLIHIPDWTDACEQAALRVERLAPSSTDLFGRLARAWIDRAIDLAGSSQAWTLLERAKSWCERDETSGRTRGLASMQRARVLMLAKRDQEAADLVSAVYNEHPGAQDGFTHLGWIARRRGGVGAMMPWLERDASWGRLSRGSQKVYAVDLARLGRWESALAALTPLIDPDAGKSGVFTEFSARLLKHIRPIWKHFGLTRRMEKLLSDIADLLRGLGAGGADLPPKAARSLAYCLAMLGHEGQLSRVMERIEHVDPVAADELKTELSALLIAGGEFHRATSWLEGLEPNAVRGRRLAVLRACYLEKTGDPDRAEACLDSFSRANSVARGLRTQFAWRHLIGVQRAWLATGGTPMQETGILRRCRDLLFDEQRLGQDTNETVLRQTQLDLFCGALDSARRRIDALYASDESACDSFGEIAALLEDAGHPDLAADWMDRDVAAGRLRSVPLLLRRAGWLARTGDLTSAEALVSGLYEENPTATGLWAQVATHVAARTTRAFELGEDFNLDDPAFTQAEALCLRDEELLRADPKGRILAARLTLMKGDGVRSSPSPRRISLVVGWAAEQHET